MQQIGDPPYNIPSWPSGPIIHAGPSPRATMMINVPLSYFGVTVVTMDKDGNITIKVDQPSPE